MSTNPPAADGPGREGRALSAGLPGVAPPTHADVAWRFLDLLGQRSLASAMEHCAEGIVLHAGTGGAEEVTVTGRPAVGRFLARLLAPRGSPLVRKKGLMVHGDQLAVMAATEDQDPVVLRFSLDGPRITELWVDL